MKLSRRNALKAGAAAAVIASPALATSRTNSRGDDSELLALERELKAIKAAWNAAGGMSDEEFDKWGDRVDNIEEKIMSTPVHGSDGLLVKWRYLQWWHSVGMGEGLDAAAEAFDVALTAVLGRASELH